MKQPIIPVGKEHLELLIKQEISSYGNSCDLNHIDVSNITDLSSVFYGSRFTGDVSKWDVSNVTDMSYMFSNSKFNSDISRWDVSKVTQMSDLFSKSKFTKDLSFWPPLNLDSSINVFRNSKAPIPYWAKYSRSEERIKAIDSYILFNKMNNNLSQVNSKSKKIKI